MTVRNKVPSESILVGTLLSTVISRGIIFYSELVVRKKAHSKNTCDKMGTTGNKC
jgi:hypothetical protein